MTLPVACLLTAPELRERRGTALADFRTAQREAREVADSTGEGYAFRLIPSGTQLAALAELIELERQCCPFLHFCLTVEPAGGPVWLTLTGPAGTRDFLRHELGLVSEAGPAPPSSI